jgi:hypothetical protein
MRSEDEGEAMRRTKEMGKILEKLGTKSESGLSESFESGSFFNLMVAYEGRGSIRGSRLGYIYV